MEIRARIKTLTLLMCLFNLTAYFIAVDLSKSLAPQIIILSPFAFLGFVIIYFFYQGKNWARILMLISAVLNLIFLLAQWMTYPGILPRLLIGADGIFSIYLLTVLNQDAVKAYFRKDVADPPEGKRGIPVWAKVILVLLAIVLPIAGAGYYAISKFKSNLERMEIWIEDLSTGAFRQLTHDGPNVRPAFSPNGDKIVFSHITNILNKKNYSTLRILSLASGQIETLLDDGNFNTDPDWSPDSGAIDYVSNAGGQKDIWQYSLAGREKKKITDDTAEESNMSLSPDGRWLLFMQKMPKGDGHEIFLVDSQGGEKKRLTVTDNFLGEPKDPVWAPDSKEIAFFSFVNLVVMDLGGKIIDQIDLSGLNNFADPVFDSKDSDRIYFKARPAQDIALQYDFYVVSRKTREIKALRKASLFEVDYRINPAGDRLIYSKPS